MKPTILISAYAVNPFKGSEDGTGWNISKQLSRHNRCVIVTRKNNAPEITRYFQEHPEEASSDMQFVYYDLPRWARRVKKKLGERGYVLYFYFWQLFLPMFLWRSKVTFDLAYALNFHSDSTPHFLWVFRKPVIWGPIGHHPKVPSSYLRFQSFGFRVKDWTYNALKWTLRNLDPFFYLAKWHSDAIIGINTSVAKVMRLAPGKSHVIPAVGGDITRKIDPINPGFTILSVGRFTPIKGFDITIQAFHLFYQSLPITQQKEVKLRLIGKGECEDDLRLLVNQLGISSAVEFVNWIPKEKMAQVYQEADVFLFPSHEGAGMVVPEAMSYGLPVICFDNYGPGELVGPSGIKIPYSKYEDSIVHFAKKLYQLHAHPEQLEAMGALMRNRFDHVFTWEHKGNEIQKIIDGLLPSSVTSIAVFHPSAELYGADRIMVNALQAMPEEVHKYVYLFRNGPLTDFLTNAVPNAHIVVVPTMPVIYRQLFTPRGVVKFIRSWWFFRQFMRQEHRKHSFKSGYVNTLSCCFLLPILNGVGMPRYIHVHEIIDRPKIIGYVTAWMSKWFANQVLCVSGAVKKGLTRYTRFTPSQLQVIHNGIAPIEVEKKTVDQTLTFYLFGRIKPEKGQWYLMEALKKVHKDSLRNARFILMGGVVPGQEALLDELKHEIKEAALHDVVTIEGFAPCISQAMSKADVCLVPSLMKDPFPTTVLEAMSAGKPVISTNHGGAKEAIVDAETGFLIAPNNAEQFAHALTQVITNKSRIRELGRQGKKRFESLFTLQHFQTNWRSLAEQYQWI